MTLGLDCLSVNDKTLWMSKLSDALSNFATTEKKFLTKQKSGESLLDCFVFKSVAKNLNFCPGFPAHDNETRESPGRLMLIIQKGEHLFDQNKGKRHAHKMHVSSIL